jgi:hypothetical protein
VDNDATYQKKLMCNFGVKSRHDEVETTIGNLCRDTEPCECISGNSGENSYRIKKLDTSAHERHWTIWKKTISLRE